MFKRLAGDGNTTTVPSGQTWTITNFMPNMELGAPPGDGALKISVFEPTVGTIRLCTAFWNEVTGQIVVDKPNNSIVVEGGRQITVEGLEDWNITCYVD